MGWGLNSVGRSSGMNGPYVELERNHADVLLWNMTL